LFKRKKNFNGKEIEDMNKILSLQRTINDLQNMYEWAVEDGELKDLSQHELNVLWNALRILKQLSEIK
jgi:hypothetical protein